jgi:L-threonylcarbamoyladenylate synthase
MNLDKDYSYLKDQVFVMPTETVYGLMADATNPNLVKKIYEIKNRPTDNPLICHFYSVEQITKYVDPSIVPEYWQSLVSELSPGPATYLIPVDSQKSQLTPALAGQSAAGIRIPDHQLALKILRDIDTPLAGPSANTSGRYSGTSYDMVKADLGNKVNCIIDGGDSVIGLESTIIDCTLENQVSIARPGFVGIKEIREALDKAGFSDVKVIPKKVLSSVTPGSKYKHYSPDTPLTRISNLYEADKDKPLLVVCLNENEKDLSVKFSKIINLGDTLPEVAHNLYHSLFELDQYNSPKALIYFGQNYHSQDGGLKEALENRFSKILAG